MVLQIYIIGKIFKFQFNTTLESEKNVVIALVDRGIILTSPLYRPEILQKITKILNNNHYPTNFIKKIITQRLNKHYNSHNQQKNAHNQNISNKTYITIPYIKDLSEKLNKCVKPYNLHIANKNHNNLRMLHTRLKAPTPFEKQTHLIYKIPCDDCDSTYIGQTKQYLKNRLQGHKSSKNLTALKKHENNSGHKFNLDKTKIIAKESNYYARNVLEMIHIKKDKNSINDRTDISNLSKIYHSLI